ncbi:hypothetical protein chiPu_0015777 [Chiloscyllium punctatum]|uniref:Uncharacterized protein n=1 Tax=Chiloscyllium punctatum TaxID=137246 RepID=A0A401T3T4_CHIPU|nr:hypothetical protein [Chiloscyllium punctatum]
MGHLPLAEYLPFLTIQPLRVRNPFGDSAKTFALWAATLKRQATPQNPEPSADFRHDNDKQIEPGLRPASVLIQETRLQIAEDVGNEEPPMSPSCVP